MTKRIELTELAVYDGDADCPQCGSHGLRRAMSGVLVQIKERWVARETLTTHCPHCEHVLYQAPVTRCPSDAEIAALIARAEGGGT